MTKLYQQWDDLINRVPNLEPRPVCANKKNCSFNQFGYCNQHDAFGKLLPCEFQEKNEKM